MSRINEYVRLLRRLRADPRLWDEDDRIYNLIGKAQKRLFKLRSKEPQKTGPFSGLTKNELRQSGTVETDWF